jgi:hypothetical protein
MLSTFTMLPGNDNDNQHPLLFYRKVNRGVDTSSSSRDYIDQENHQQNPSVAQHHDYHCPPDYNDNTHHSNNKRTDHKKRNHHLSQHDMTTNSNDHVYRYAANHTNSTCTSSTSTSITPRTHYQSIATLHPVPPSYYNDLARRLSMSFIPDDEMDMLLSPLFQMNSCSTTTTTTSSTTSASCSTSAPSKRRKRSGERTYTTTGFNTAQRVVHPPETHNIVYGADEIIGKVSNDEISDFLQQFFKHE